MQYYTPQQAAKELGVCTRTLMRWRKEDVFVPDVRTRGGHSRYSKAQIDLAKEMTQKSEGQSQLGDLLS